MYIKTTEGATTSSGKIHQPKSSNGNGKLEHISTDVISMQANVDLMKWERKGEENNKEDENSGEDMLVEDLGDNNTTLEQVTQ